MTVPHTAESPHTVALFDLTMPVSPTMPAYPGDPPLRIKRAASHEIDGFEVTHICLGSHSGTHVEAPRHFLPQGKGLDEFPLERLVGPGVVYDCRVTTDAALLRRLAEQLRRHPLPEMGVALVWTEGRPLTLSAAELLVEARAGLVGIDAASIDLEPYPVHRHLLAHDVLIAENLAHLDRLGAGPIHCCLLPLALEGTEAAPARAVAWRYPRS